jgi:hypothetical protein
MVLMATKYGKEQKGTSHLYLKISHFYNSPLDGGQPLSLEKPTDGFLNDE